MTTDNKDDIKAAEELRESFDRIKSEIGKVIIGQSDVIEKLLIAVLSRGHCLLIGVPGLAKTLLIRTLAEVLDLNFSRIQFTPDLMPSDITGTEILEDSVTKGKRDFRFIKGPIFANIVLADEINRTPPKTQAALLQAMQEYKVTAGNETFELEEPFFVLATQNPIEQEGTYPLPEAQVDRFMLKLKLDYPNRKEERDILDRMSTENIPQASRAVGPEEILRARRVVEDVYMDDRIKEYIISIVFATREPSEFGLDIGDLIEYGGSPRASLYLVQAARAHAFVQGRGYVTPEDVKSVGADVLRHRVILSYEAEAENVTSEEIIQRIFDTVEVP